LNNFNIKIDLDPQKIKQAYDSGLLPQRNQAGLFYSDSSCRSTLKNFKLSSENKRILAKTTDYASAKLSKSDFNFNHQIQKQSHLWAKSLSWQFPTASIKTVFTNHIFNTFYTWSHQNQIIAYAVCYFSPHISHIAYVFYNPDHQKTNLVNAIVLKTIIDSQALGLDYCYLGRFDPSQNIGYYKRNMPGFQVYNYQKQIWLSYKKYKQL